MGKTECVIFGTKNKLKNVNDFQIISNDHVIPSQKSVKYLGLNIDQYVSGEAIAKSVIQKNNSRLKFLYRQAKCLGEQSRKTLCSALLQCHFDYAASSWYCGITQDLKNKLQVCQNKIVRFIKNWEPRAHIGTKELSSVGLLNVDNRVVFLRLNHVFKNNNNSNAPYMSDHFSKISDSHNHNTRRSSHNFVLPRVKGKGSSTFYYNAIKDWNALPDNIKTINSISVFKSSVKKFLKAKALTDETSQFVT
jgi:hypothetical protein